MCERVLCVKVVCERVVCVCVCVCVRVVCERVVCKRVVCERVVCKRVVCERVVCKRVVCERVVCERVVCERVSCEGLVCDKVVYESAACEVRWTRNRKDNGDVARACVCVCASMRKFIAGWPTSPGFDSIPWNSLECQSWLCFCQITWSDYHGVGDRTRLPGRTCHACHAKRRLMWASATRATQNEGQCEQAPRLPSKPKADVSKRHACHAKRRSMSPSAAPAMQTEGWCEHAPRLPCKVARCPGRLTATCGVVCVTKQLCERLCDKVVCERWCVAKIAGERLYVKDCVWQSCVWKIVCVKGCVWKIVFDKVVCERLRVRKLYVCARLCVCVTSCAWKIVRVEDCVCVWNSFVCERLCDKVVRERLCVCVWQRCAWKIVCVTKLCVKVVCERLCVQGCVCDKVVCERMCVTKLCVTKRARKEEETGYRTKNNNLTQRCGEMTRIRPDVAVTCSTVIGFLPPIFRIQYNTLFFEFNSESR